MVEKMGGVVAIVASMAVMMTLSRLNLPLFITIPLVFVCVMIYLCGVVFLFAEGQILTKDHGEKRTPKVG